MPKKRKSIITNPLTQWLLDYVDEHDVNLTELSVQAGLSAGSLRSLVTHPERIPALETCLRLSKVTGKPADEIFQMAGMHGYGSEASLDPDRLGLVQTYQGLSDPMRHVLVSIAKVLEAAQLQDE